MNFVHYFIAQIFEENDHEMSIVSEVKKKQRIRTSMHTSEPDKLLILFMLKKMT